MTFCTLLEWQHEFDFDRYRQLNERAGPEELPDGCLTRVVGPLDGGGACVIEVWESAERAGRFAERTSPAIAELQVRPPDRVTAFAPTIYASS